MVFAGMVAGGAAGSTQVYVSRDAGRHWDLFGRGLDSHGGIMALAATGGSVYAGTMGNQIWVASLVGPTWRRAASGIPERQHVSGIATIPGRPRALFITTLGAGVFRSRDAGRHWTRVSDGLPQQDGQQVVLAIAYDAIQRMLYGGTPDGVYRLSIVQS